MKILTDEQISFFRANGYLNYGPVLTEQEVSDLREGLDAVLAERSAAYVSDLGKQDPSNTILQIVNMWRENEAFRRHIYNPTITAMIAQLIGCDTIRVWHDQMQMKPPRVGGPTDWHQDHPYWPIIQPADLVSAWVAIEDATIENGCMSMVPQSYLWGRYKDGTIGTDPVTYEPTPDPSLLPAGAKIEAVPCEVKAGSVVFHHCLEWHGAPANRSDKRRPAIAVHYMPGYTRYEPGDHGDHLIHSHVDVAPGEILTGPYFPTVRENGAPVQP